MPSFYRNPICKLNCSAVDPKELPNLYNKTRSSGLSPYEHCYPDSFNKTETYPMRVDRVIGWLKSDDPPRFVALYIDAPDWKGHSDGALKNTKTPLRRWIEMLLVIFWINWRSSLIKST